MLLYPKTLSREKTFAKSNISLIFLNNLSRMSDFKSFTENRLSQKEVKFAKFTKVSPKKVISTRQLIHGDCDKELKIED